MSQYRRHPPNGVKQRGYKCLPNREICQVHHPENAELRSILCVDKRHEVIGGARNEFEIGFDRRDGVPQAVPVNYAVTCFVNSFKFVPVVCVMVDRCEASR
jgi:hypothetical protein